MTPFGTARIDFRVGDLNSTGFIPSADIVLEKIDLLSTLRAGNIKNILRFPIPQVLSRTLHEGFLDRLGFPVPF